MSVKDEIMQQPAALDRLLRQGRESARSVAKAIRERDVRFVFLGARGASDNAGIYARYLWGSINGLPLALATPSLFTMYEQPPRLRDALVLGISQSGRTADVERIVGEGKRQGALTLVLTNEPDSPLGSLADHVFPIQAGVQQSPSAIKTYSNTLMALAMISACLDEDHSEERLDALERVPKAIESLLRLDETIEHAAERYRYMNRCVVLGRGYNYATAFEWALKLTELGHVIAQPYSAIDFRHGPITMVSRGFPVFAVAVKGPVLEDALGVMSLLKNEHNAELVVISDDDEALRRGRVALPLANGLPEWVTPILSIVPAQLFAYHLARSKGHDVTQPPGLRADAAEH